MGAFDDAALRLKSNQSQQEAPDPFDGAARRFEENREAKKRQRLKQSFATTKDADPEQSGRALQVSGERGLPVGTVKRNMDKFRDEPDIETIANETPVLADTLSDPDNAAAMRDDIENMSWFERVWRDTAQGFRRGKSVTYIGDVGWAALEGRATPEQIQKARSLMQEPETDFDLGTFSEMPGTSAEMFPLMVKVVGRSIDEILVGAALGAAVGSPGGPPGMLAGSVTGASAGGIGGIAVESGKFEAGSAYLEYLEFKDENGNPMDPDAARAAAMFVGPINGILEAYGLGKILESVPGLNKLLGQFSREGVKQLLRQPSIRKSFASAGKAITGATVAESITEGTQELSTIINGEIAKVRAEGDYEPITTEELIERVLSAMKEAAKGTPGLALPGATVQVGIDAANVRRAKQNQALFKALGDKSKSSKTLKRAPKKKQEQIKKLRDVYEGLDFVYVDAGRLNTFFQENEIDSQTLQRDMPGTAEDLAEAMVAGTDVAVPMEEFIAHVAPTAAYEQLLPDLKLSPSDISVREAAAIEQAQEEYAQILSEQEREQGADTIGERIRAQLTEAGTEETAADTQAQMWSAFFRTMGERVGQDPLELFESFNVQVQREAESEGLEGALNALRDNNIPEETKDADLAAQRERLLELQEQLAGRGIDLAETTNEAAIRALTGPEYDISVTDEEGVTRINILDQAGESVGRFEAEESPNQGFLRVHWQEIDPQFQGQGIATRVLADMARRAQEKGLRLASDMSVSPEAARAYEALERRGAEVITNPHTVSESTGNLVSGDVTTPVFEVVSVPEDRTLEQAARELLQEGREQPRGRIQFPDLEQSPDKWFKITLTGKANLSTFLHESGHFFLEAFRDIARQENAPEDIRQDWQKIREFLELEGEDIPTNAHEKWARAWEGYTMEGKAPSVALADAFERFKTWLFAIYRNMRSLDVELSDDIRDVMDRMLASRREIREAHNAQNYGRLFDSPETAGMTRAEYETYRKLHDRAMREAENDLDRRLMAEIRRQRTEEYRRQRDKIRGEVEAEADQMPGYRAEAYLRRGVVPEDIELPPSLEGKKLNKQALQDLYPDRDITKPMAFTYVAEGGVHPDVLAPYFGFETGREMVDTIIGQDRRSEFIKAEVQKRLRADSTDPMLDGSVAEEAIEAAHNDKRGRFLLAEVNALGKRVGADKISQIDVIKLAARRRVLQLRHLDLRPHRYRQAEIKHAKQAQKAIGEQDYALAHEAKRKQLLNHYLYRESLSAREEIESARTYLRRFDEKKTRERIGKAGGEYLEQIDNLLERVEFKRTTVRRIRQRSSLNAWIAEQEAEGRVVAVPDWLRNEAQTKNWREMTVAEVRGVRDSVKNIASMARLKNKLQYAKEARDLDEAISQVVGQIDANAPRLREQINQNPTWWEKKKETLSAFNASLTKMEFLARWMDGGEVGAAHELIFQPFVDAQKAEYEMLSGLGMEIISPLRDMPKEQRARLNQTVMIPQLGRRMMVKDLLVAFLNMGNEGNKEKLLKGYGWGERELLAAFDQHLTREDMELAQKLLDGIDKLWPFLAEVYKRSTGLEPPKIEAMPITTRHGTFRGGYFPVVHDRRRSHQAEINQQKGDLFENNYLRASVAHGFTEQRTKFHAPIQLSLDVVPAHITDVIHYITHFEAVQAVDKLTSRAPVAKAITEAFGKEQYQIIRPWLQALANNGKPPTFLRGLDDAMRHLRSGMTVYAMGLKLTTGITQLFGLATTIDGIGIKYTARGMRKFLTNPGETWRYANENSGEIRFATRTFDRDVKAQIDKLMGQRNVPQDIVNYSLYHIGYIQKAVNVMTWTGSYERAIDAGKTHEQAVRQAESDVRTTQGSGAVKDLPAIMRGPETARAFTMFYTYFATLYGRFQDVSRTTKGVKDIPRFAARWNYLVMLPILFDAFLLGRGPDESEDESWVEFMLLQNVLYPITSVPFVRDITSGALGKYGYDITPIAAALEDITAGGREFYEYLVKGDDLPPSFNKKLATAVGVLGRLPTGQLWNTKEWAQELVEGDLNNPLREFFQGVDRED